VTGPIRDAPHRSGKPVTLPTSSWKPPTAGTGLDVLQAAGARVHLAHPLGVKAFAYRRRKDDIRDAHDLVDLLRMGGCRPELFSAGRERV
jgi:hypothetical protein